MNNWRIGDIQPNPFRNIDRYPIDPAKVDRLKASINQTTFWDNLIARIGPDGRPQIAYGHHRLVALRDLYPPDHTVSLIVRGLDDASMLRIMANENMEEWRTAAAVVKETVRATRDYLRSIWTPESKSSNAETGDGREEITAFLGWPERRVKDALSLLNAEEAGELLPEDTADMGIEVATVMRQHVARIPDPVVRREAISRVRQDLKTGTIGKRGIGDTVRAVKAEASAAPTVPVPNKVAKALDADIYRFFEDTVPVGENRLRRDEVIRLIARFRNAAEMQTLNGRSWADDVADHLDKMAATATELAALLRAERALEGTR